MAWHDCLRILSLFASKWPWLYRSLLSILRPCLLAIWHVDCQSWLLVAVQNVNGNEPRVLQQGRAEAPACVSFAIYFECVIDIDVHVGTHHSPCDAIKALYHHIVLTSLPVPSSRCWLMRQVWDARKWYDGDKLLEGGIDWCCSYGNAFVAIRVAWSRVSDFLSRSLTFLLSSLVIKELSKGWSFSRHYISTFR